MLLSIIIPVLNEADGFSILHDKLEEVFTKLPCDYEVIFINDGSTDNTSEKIQEWINTNNHIVLLELSRNFGHQSAITAGLHESKGDAVIVMDADLQDPPNLIPELLAQWNKGYKVVIAQRRSRGENFIRKMLFNAFYKIFDLLSDFPIKIASGVFGLMDRTVVDHLTLMKEQNRFIPGMRAWLGFKTAVVTYDRQPRAFGEPKQSLRKLIKYGFDALFSFSYKPLRLSFFLGLIVSSLCFSYAFVLLVLRLLNVNVVSGFTTVAIAIFFIGGVLLISNGILGEYLGRIYDEVKKRPYFIIERKISHPKNQK